MVCMRVRGPIAALVGADSAVQFGSANVIPAPSVTLGVTDGSSIVLAFAGQRSTDPDMTQPPTGMVNAAGGAGTSCVVGGNYTSNGVTSWSSANASVGGTASGYATITLEVTGAV